MNIEAVYWLTGLVTIGFVVCRRVEGWKCYIGVPEKSEEYGGNTEERDKKFIAENGTSVEERIARAIFPEMKGKYVK